LEEHGRYGAVVHAETDGKGSLSGKKLWHIRVQLRYTQRATQLTWQRIAKQHNEADAQRQGRVHLPNSARLLSSAHYIQKLHTPTFNMTSVVLFSWRKGRDVGDQMPWMANGASKARWSKNTEELTWLDAVVSYALDN
jgi:hypothetical protein